MLSLSYCVARCITYLALRCKDFYCLYGVVCFPAVALRLGVCGLAAPWYFLSPSYLSDDF